MATVAAVSLIIVVAPLVFLGVDSAFVRTVVFMAEALAAVGAVASIIQLVQFSSDILTRIKEYDAQRQDIPKVFRSMKTQLPLLISTLNSLRDDDTIENLSADHQESLAQAVQGLFKETERLNGLVSKMLPVPTDSAFQRRQKAIQSVLKAGDVQKILNEIERFKTTLILEYVHRGVRSPSISPTTPPSDLTFPLETESFYNVPSLHISNFVPRPQLMQELESTVATIPSSKDRPKVVVLLGMGGQGKTQLVLEYCRQCRDSMPPKFQSIFWIEASSRNSINQSFDTLAAKLAPPGHIFDSSDEAEAKIAFVKDALARSTKPFLLVFDNFDDPRDCPNIDSFFPPSGHGVIIFTSRHSDTQQLGSVIHFNGLTEGEGMQLLFPKGTDDLPDTDRTAGSTILDRLGYLPLAVDQAQSYIHARRLRIQDFLGVYEKRKERILTDIPTLWKYRKRLGGARGDTPLNVFTTLDLSFDQLATVSGAEAHGRFLSLAAFFDRSCINEDFFKSAFEMPEFSDLLSVFTDDDGWDCDKFGDALVSMERLSLIQLLPSGTVFSLHPLISEWLKSRLKKEERAQFAINSTLLLAHYLAGFTIQERRFRLSLELKQQLLSHIEACTINQRTYASKFSCADDQLLVLARAWSEFSQFYFEMGKFKLANSLTDESLAVFEKVLGAEHPDTLATRHTLGVLLWKLGHLDEAGQSFQIALKGREAALGPDDPETLTTVNRLALLYREQGKLVESQRLVERALDGYEANLGPEHPKTLYALNNLGMVYHNRNMLEESEKVYLRALTGYEKKLARDHDDVLRVVNNLGCLNAKKGDLGEAERYFQWAVEGYEKSLGFEHPATLDTLNNIAMLYHDQNRSAESEAIYLRTLTGREKVYGQHHSLTLYTRMCLGIHYLTLEDLEKADQLLDVAVPELGSTPSANHPKIREVVDQLVSIQKRLGRDAEADKARAAFPVIDSKEAL